MPFELQLSGRGQKISRANNNTLPPQIELPSAAYAYDHDLPGVLLKKGGHVVWTPIAARTRPRFSFRDSQCSYFLYTKTGVFNDIIIIIDIIKRV